MLRTCSILEARGDSKDRDTVSTLKKPIFCHGRDTVTKTVRAAQDTRNEVDDHSKKRWKCTNNVRRLPIGPEITIVPLLTLTWLQL